MNQSIIRKWANKVLPRKLRKLPAEEVFDKIYQEGTWGEDEHGNATSGSGSHAIEIVKPYVNEVSGLLKTLEKPVVVDLGCGDFNVGSQLAALSERYIACDVSSQVLQTNRRKYAIPNVEFRKVNIITDELPAGDVCFIRQVLQHLSNDDIREVVRKINDNSAYRYLIVTEHVPEKPDYVANLDHRKGAGIRMNQNSGVDIAKPPFNLAYQSKEILLSVKADVVGEPGQVLTTHYTLV